MHQVRVSVIIVSWNTRELLSRCIASLGEDARTSPDVILEVIVVDNASSDGSADMVAQAFPSVHLIRNRVNVGFARANNQALQHSSGKYILLLNPDAELQPGATASLVRFMDRTPGAGAAGARLVDVDGETQTSCAPAPTLTRELWRLLHLDVLVPFASYPIKSWALDIPRLVETVQGACMILRREALDEVGPLDEDYFIYSEEVDLCYRLRRNDWSVYWIPEARVIHHGGQSTRQVATAMFLRLYQGKVLYFRKNHGRPATHAYKVILLVAALPRLLHAPFAGLGSPEYRKRHFALAARYGRMIMALPRY